LRVAPVGDKSATRTIDEVRFGGVWVQPGITRKAGDSQIICKHSARIGAIKESGDSVYGSGAVRDDLSSFHLSASS
jgi:hypothetical protein